MSIKIVFFLSIIFLLSACGGGQKERESIIKSAEQNPLNDSLRRKAEMKLEQDIKQALSDSLVRIQKEIQIVTAAIGHAKAEYQVQTDKLGKIKKFKILRNKEEREQQIREQSDVLYKLERKISDLEYQLVNLQVRLDYYNSEMNRSIEK
jgi:hypothetical protein